MSRMVAKLRSGGARRRGLLPLPSPARCRHGRGRPRVACVHLRHRDDVQRRHFLSCLATFCSTGSLLNSPARAVPLVPLGKAQPFDYAWLKGHARALAGRAYQPARNSVPKAIEALDWDQYLSLIHI